MSILYAMLNSPYAGWAAAVALPLVTYLGLRIRFGGSIRSSEAVDIWKESSSIRKELHEQVAGLLQRVDELGRQVVAEQEQRLDCQRRLTSLEHEHETLKFNYGVLLVATGDPPPK